MQRQLVGNGMPETGGSGRTGQAESDADLRLRWQPEGGKSKWKGPGSPKGGGGERVGEGGSGSVESVSESVCKSVSECVREGGKQTRTSAHRLWVVGGR